MALTKPFRFEELLVRIRARIRTAAAIQNGNLTEMNILQVGEVILDKLTVGSKPTVSLSTCQHGNLR